MSCELLVVVCPYDVQEFDNIRMTPEFLKEHDFTECSLSICLIPEGIEDFLQSDSLLRASIGGFQNNPVSPFPKPLMELVPLPDVSFHLIRHHETAAKLNRLINI